MGKRGIGDGRTAVGAVDDARIKTPLPQGRHQVRKTPVLELGVVVLRRGVGHGEVHEDSLRPEPGQGGQGQDLLHRLRPVVGKEAQAAHARVRLDMDAEGAAGVCHGPSVLQGMDLLGDVQGRLLRRLLRGRIAQDQDGQGNLRPPELQGLLEVGNRQVFRPQLLKLPGHRHRPVAVGVRLHHPQEPAAPGPPLPQQVHVVGQIVKIHLRPGSPEHFAVHGHSPAF